MSEVFDGNIKRLLKPTIILDELSIPSTLRTTDDSERIDTDTPNIEDLYAFEFPMVRIRGHLFTDKEIIRLEISADGKLPKVYFQASTTSYDVFQDEIPLDGDIISVAIRPTSNNLQPIRNDYIINSYSIKLNHVVNDIGTEATADIIAIGTLFVPGFDSTNFSYSQIGTSMDVLKSLAVKLQLGFCSNIEQTNDKQVWISANSSPRKFIETIVDHSWKNTESFFDWWIDVYYNINFIDVDNMLKKDKQPEISEGYMLRNFSTGYFWPKSDKGLNEEIKVPRVLTNNRDLMNTPFFITNYNITNNCNNVVISRGAVVKAQYLDQGLIQRNYDSKSVGSMTFEGRPVYDIDKYDKYIRLGDGRVPDKLKIEGMRYQHWDVNTYNVNSPWLGIQYTNDSDSNDISEWTGNTHKYFLAANIHNTINNTELNKLVVTFKVQGFNANIFRGDIIFVQIIEQNLTKRTLNENIGDNIGLTRFYSGWYYVKGFSLKYNMPVGTSSPFTRFKHDIIVSRREWPTPIMSAIDSQDNSNTLNNDSLVK